MANNNGQGPWVTAIRRIGNALGNLLPARRALKFGAGFVVTDVPDGTLGQEVTGYTAVDVSGVVTSASGLGFVDVDNTDPAAPVISLDPAPTTTATASTIPVRNANGALVNDTDRWLASFPDLLDVTKATEFHTDTKAATATGGQQTGFISRIVKLFGWNGAASAAFKGAYGTYYDGDGVAHIFVNDTGGATQQLTLNGDGSVDIGGILAAPTGTTPTVKGQLGFDADGVPLYYDQSGAVVRTVAARGQSYATGVYAVPAAGISLVDIGANKSSGLLFPADFGDSGRPMTVKRFKINGGALGWGVDGTNWSSITIVRKKYDGTGSTVLATLTNQATTFAAGVDTYYDFMGTFPMIDDQYNIFWNVAIGGGLGSAIPAGLAISVGLNY